MRSWLGRLRISAALDAGGQPSGWLGRTPSASPELRAVEKEMAALDAALKGSAPRVDAPESLHRSIMQAVRAANRRAEAPRHSNVLRWLPAPVLAAILLLGLVWAMHSRVQKPVQNAPTLVAAATAVHLGDDMVRAMPAAVVAPLSNELDRLNRDLDNTARFLLASFP